MSIIAPDSPLSARAARVLAQICAAESPVTVVAIGSTDAIEGTVSFAHGGRVAVVSRAEVEAFGLAEAGVVLVALWDGRAIALTGRVRDVGPSTLSLEMVGDLSGADPRVGVRAMADQGDAVRLQWDDSEVTVRVWDRSARGLAVMMAKEGPVPAVGSSVWVVGLAGGEPVAARVRHQTPQEDLPGPLRLGLELAGNGRPESV